MAKRPVLTPRELLRLLREAGFVEDHQTGSHLILIHPQDKRRAVETIPNHKNLAKGILGAILKHVSKATGRPIDALIEMLR